jgi:predicted nucleic-acid-binding Zn-ribbon protein
MTMLGDDILRCPKCGSSHLHHGEVAVYTREETRR